ncbi:MAG: PrsW family intramembrane metalloprotease [Treponema sp.]|jgi:RsiW-degrading membrane proteinase PrsW (M82 family)|nr:PrsW family intramembrane metalloprotease [Treponema sp.]
MLFLLLPIFVVALPVFAAFFLRRKLGVSSNLFLLCLLTGTVSIAPAAVVQYFIPPVTSLDIKGILFNVFCRVAFTEESSRFLLLSFFFSLLDSFKKLEKERNASHFTAIGLVAGLGFALAESAAYSANNVQVILLRGFTTAPMHAACGARAGAAVFFMKESPGVSVWRFVTAVVIHGTYNILAVSPGIMRFLSILLVFLALFSAMKQPKDI